MIRRHHASFISTWLLAARQYEIFACLSEGRQAGGWSAALCIAYGTGKLLGISIANTNHFTILDQLRQPNSTTVAAIKTAEALRAELTDKIDLSVVPEQTRS